VKGFLWIKEVEPAFKWLKELLVGIQALVNPIPKGKLFIYIIASDAVASMMQLR